MILSSFEQRTEQEHLEQESKLVDMKEKMLTLESNIAEHDVELKENVRLLQVMTDDHALQVCTGTTATRGALHLLVVL